MYRKLSVPGRRSSVLTRLSAPNELQDERNGRRQSDGKKSLIPRPTGMCRSSSAERDIIGSTIKSRSASLESNADRNLKSARRSRSVENLTTPKNPVNTPAVGSRISRVTSTCKKSVRKDSRPLSERAFQNYELTKVHEYLINVGIIQPYQIREVQSPLTLKMFVHIMNSLLQKLAPSISLTVGNYAEIIPNFMKKLKYPGTINRSWLVTANSPHSWPYVLGIISWLTHILISDCKLQYFQGDEILEPEKMKKLLSNTVETYVKWDEDGVMGVPEEEEKFFHEFLQDKNEVIDAEILSVQKEIESLQSLASEINIPEKVASQEKLKNSLQLLGSMKTEIIKMKENLQNLTLSVKKGADELLILRNGIENEKSNLSVSVENQSKHTDDCETKLITEDLDKLQSEVVRLENVIKYQKTHVGEITSHCYNDDLAIARQRSLLDKMVLKREAVLRNCTIESLDTNELQIKINIRDADYSDTMKSYIGNLQEMVNKIKQNVNKLSNEEKDTEKEINQLSENVKYLNENISKIQAEEILINKEMENKKKKIANLEKEISEKLNKTQERVLQLQQEKEEQELLLLAQLKEEHDALLTSYQNDTAKYQNILDQCNEELQKQIKNCTELMKNTVFKK